MSNPYFSNSDVFGEPKRQGAQRRGGVGTQQAPGATATQPAPQYGQAGSYGAQATDTASLEYLYGAPSATTADTKRLTYDDVIIKTGGLLALLVVVAAATWKLAPGIWPLGMVVGLVLGLVNSFKRNPSPVLISLYTVAQGVFLGGISKAFEGGAVGGQPIPGLVVQAVLATMVTFGAALFLYKSGRVRVTPKFTRWLIIAMVGFLAFQFINLVLVWTNVLEGAGARGGGLGVVVGLVAVGLAAASLIMDFDSIKRGVEQGVPARFAWSAAFGLMVTLIWLYLEFLRLIAILQGRD
ncbi:Bax inhibitor-1/YccA family protein [Xylanimonas protaetiae]|uniref:Bax inhibitor-1/YccA family protein n=1 Tax=Xylanimonas protaetiae TaxID=2509457 RepID=A0A4P6EZU8_9MICO|nr:Bax inhibitor-1/YccA family protein [Xylanimonas protaetiae]QAY68990.1 Bax inhibitor-1/YccA family protein [Xylanimonas protaetiae]